MPTVLLIEDNEMNRDMLTRRLERKGFAVATAGDGRQGVATALAGSFDLILMDLSLPELDGWEATRQLRADPRTQSVPIIALTAHAMPGDRDKAIAAGCNDYETKPVEFPRLLGLIETHLKARVVPSSDPTPNPPARPSRTRLEAFPTTTPEQPDDRATPML